MTITNPSGERVIDAKLDLNDEFRFSLVGHVLRDPVVNEGEVASVRLSESRDTSELGCDIYEVKVIDPFVRADPETYAMVSGHIEHMERLMQASGYNPLDARSEASNPDEYNEFTCAWLNDPTLAGLRIWRGNVPHAEALGYLTNPWVGNPITNLANESGTISPETAAYLRFVDDAVAIRDRRTAMEHIAGEHLAEAAALQSRVRWLSLASGTAEPAISVAKKAEEHIGVDVDLTVADWDGRALKYVARNAERYGFQGNINTLRMNILADNLRALIEEKTGEVGQYEVVENMGFEEYLPQDGDELGAVAGAGLPQASEFTRNAWELVAPGGSLISGNMILGRPQLGFVFGIVDWPIINARSEESILRVYKEAGVVDDPNATISLYRVINEQTGAHIYDIVKVAKATA